MTPRTRLFGLLGLAAALWFTRDALLPAGEAPPDRSRSRPPAPRSAPVATGAPAAASADDSPRGVAALVLRGPVEAGSRHDPFAAPRPVAAPAKPAIGRGPVDAAPPPSPPPPAPPPPRLPYRFVGGLSEKGQPPSVYLTLGDKLIEARAGDTLEGGYRLDKITPRELTFIHLQQNLAVRLAVDGEPS